MIVLDRHQTRISFVRRDVNHARLPRLLNFLALQSVEDAREFLGNLRRRGVDLGPALRREMIDIGDTLSGMDDDGLINAAARRIAARPASYRRTRSRAPCATMTASSWCSALLNRKTQRPVPSASVGSTWRGASGDSESRYQSPSPFGGMTPDVPAFEFKINGLTAILFHVIADDSSGVLGSRLVRTGSHTDIRGSPNCQSQTAFNEHSTENSDHDQPDAR
jgi:hypothetical protein